MLDEPSIGLHPRDTDRLLALLHRLRDLGNTVRGGGARPGRRSAQADFMLELGPGAGEQGGTRRARRAAARGGRTRSPASTSRARSASACRARGGPPARSGSRCAAPRCTTCRAWTSTSRSARSPRSPACPGSGKSTPGPRRPLPPARAPAARRALGQVAPRRGGRRGGASSRARSWCPTCCWWTSRRSAGRPRSNPVTYVKGFDEIRELFAASRWRGARLHRRPPSRSTCRAGAARRARARGTCRWRWSSWPTSSCRATSAAAAASSARCST